MAKDQGPKSFIDQQRAIHEATIAGLMADGRFSQPLCDKLDQLSKELYEIAVYQFEYGEPDEYHKCAGAMNSLMGVVTELLNQANGKK
jgi:hypothetical protein